MPQIPQDIIPGVQSRDLAKAAARGEPSYVWRDGQQRRLEMVVRTSGTRIRGRVLENGCGVGLYAERLAAFGGEVTGLEYDRERSQLAARRAPRIVNARGEQLPFPVSTFDLILSHEVLEHVQDDAGAVSEMVRVLRPKGRVVIFCPNRGYPFETHGIYWAGKYYFGNKPFVNYLPRGWRDWLAPHVRAYSHHDLQRLIDGLQVRVVEQAVIFGGYDNLIRRFGMPARMLRAALHTLERTPLRAFGLSHFWVLEKV
jgi:SAM-dependent methyltransferase